MLTIRYVGVSLLLVRLHSYLKTNSKNEYTLPLPLSLSLSLSLSTIKPLRMLPLSIWSWQDTVKAVLGGKAHVVEVYPDVVVRAVNLDMPVPSVIALKEYAHTGKAVSRFALVFCLHRYCDVQLLFSHPRHAETSIHKTQCFSS
jgi:hypothetical protein